MTLSFQSQQLTQQRQAQEYSRVHLCTWLDPLHSDSATASPLSPAVFILYTWDDTRTLSYL